MAKGAVGGMTAAGYLSGDNGAYCPKRALTRAEIVTILNNMVRTYIDQAGTYTQNNTNGGIILVKAGRRDPEYDHCRWNCNFTGGG